MSGGSGAPLARIERAAATLRSALAGREPPRWLVVSRFGFDFLHDLAGGASGATARREPPIEVATGGSGEPLLARRLELGGLPLLALEHDRGGASSDDAAPDAAFLEALPLLLAGQLGIRGALLLLAASGLPGYRPAPSIVAVGDWIRVGDEDPLRAFDAARLGARFPEMRGLARSDDLALAAALLAAPARRSAFATAPAAVAVARRGPSGATDAELQAWRRLGGDLLVEGCAAEAVAARHQGIELLTLALVLDSADTSPVADPGELANTAAELLPRLAELLPDLLQRLAARAASPSEPRP